MFINLTGLIYKLFKAAKTKIRKNERQKLNFTIELPYCLLINVIFVNIKLERNDKRNEMLTKEDQTLPH